MLPSRRTTFFLAVATGLAFSAFLAALTVVARTNESPPGIVLLGLGLLGPALAIVVGITDGLPPSRGSLLAACVPPIIAALTCGFVLFFTGPGGIMVTGEPGRYFGLGFCALYLWLFPSAVRLIPTRESITRSQSAV